MANELRLHSQATGIHPGAYVQPIAPANPYTVGGVSYELPNGVLWVDTSSGPPYQLKLWDVATPGWLLVGLVSATGGTNCIVFPLGAQLCNPSTDLVALVTPTGLHQWDATGYTLRGGHRLETVPA